MRRRMLALVAIVVALALAVPAGAQDIATVREQVQDISERIDEAQVRADEATQRFHTAQSDLGQIELEIEGLEADVADTEVELAGLREGLREFAIERYTGEVLAPDLIEQDDLNDYTVMTSLAREAQIDRRDVIDDYRNVTARLEADTESLEVARTDQQVLIDELDAAQTAIYAELDTMETELAEMEDLLSQLEEEERRRIEAELRRQEEERRAAEAAAAATSTTEAPATTEAGDDGAGEDEADEPDEPEPEPEPPSTPEGPIATGAWVCPVQGATSFSDTWGAPRSGGRRHQGVDMLAAEGTPVVASVSGTVVHRGNSIGGESFHLTGDDGNYYYGTHLSAYGNSGYVQAGTIVGYVGETGNATTPHLHFEIHIGGYGNPVNPYPTVAQYC